MKPGSRSLRNHLTAKLGSAARLTLLLTSLIWATRIALGVILDSTELQVDFPNEEDAHQKAAWSKELSLLKEGIGWNDGPHSHGHGWVQTRPLPIGRSWRPTRAADLHVTIEIASEESGSDEAGKLSPCDGFVYVRYSPDLKHWSSWQVLDRGPSVNHPARNKPSCHYNGSLRVPQSERNDYEALLRRYAEKDVPWRRDEEAAARWIVDRQPDFFAKHLPFIGYLQFRIERDFTEAQRIMRFHASIGWGISGLGSDAKDQREYEMRRWKPWRFKAEDADLPDPIKLETSDIIVPAGRFASLHDAAATGNVEWVAYWLKLGFRVDSRDEQGWTPLHHAAKGGHVNVVKLLLEAGARVRVKAPIVPAWFEIDPELAERYGFKEVGSDADNEVSGKTALDLATGHRDIVRLLTDQLGREQQEPRSETPGRWECLEASNSS